MIIKKNQSRAIAALKMSLSGYNGDQEFYSIRTEILKDLIDTAQAYLKK